MDLGWASVRAVLGVRGHVVIEGGRFVWGVCVQFTK